MFKTFSGFAAFFVKLKGDTIGGFGSSRFDFYDEYGDWIKSATNTEVNEFMSLQTLFVPEYKADSIFKIDKYLNTRSKYFSDFGGDHYFTTNGKIGIFCPGKNEVLSKPVDYRNSLGSYEFVYTKVNNDSIYFNM